MRIIFEDGDKCPGCNRGWWLFPPAKIDGAKHLFRCIECKRVYEVKAEEVKE